MIRAFQSTDREKLIEIFKLNVPKYFDPKEVHEFAKYLDHHSDTYCTVEYENKIVGGVGYYIKNNDRSGSITWIFFHPEYAGLGLGKLAVEYCLQVLKADQFVEKFVVQLRNLRLDFLRSLATNWYE